MTLRAPKLFTAALGAVTGQFNAFRTAFVALVIAAATSLVTGLTLASITDTLEELPGLLLLVPAAIAVKGNIFGAVGCRFGTAIHAGTFSFGRLNVVKDSVVSQNTIVSLSLSLILGVALALLAKGVAVVFDVSPTMSVADFIVISTVGGMIASLVVLVITLVTSSGAVRFGLDLDNVVAPLASAAADLVTLPALVLAVVFTGIETVTATIAWSLTGIAAVALIWSLRSRLGDLRRISQESIPVLVLAGVLDIIAGITVEKRLEDFLAFPVLLVLLPGFLGTAGALGAVLSSRLGTKVHLGLIGSAPLPQGPARSDMLTVLIMSMPVFALLGVMASTAGNAAGFGGAALGDIIGVAVLGGAMAMLLTILVAYYGTLGAVRFGLDPDTYGIPMVMSSLDFFGAFTFILAAVAMGFG